MINGRKTELSDLRRRVFNEKTGQNILFIDMRQKKDIILNRKNGEKRPREFARLADKSSRETETEDFVRKDAKSFLKGKQKELAEFAERNFSRHIRTLHFVRTNAARKRNILDRNRRPRPEKRRERVFRKLLKRRQPGE